MWNVEKYYNGIDVAIILNFDCPACIEKLEDFAGLAGKFAESARFRIVYFNHVFGVEGRGLKAAHRKGKAWSMIELMARNPDRIYEEAFYLEAAKSLNLDMVSFRIDFKNHNLLKNMLLTRDFLFANQIFTTPFYVINGKGYDGQITLEQFERLILKDLK